MGIAENEKDLPEEIISFWERFILFPVETYALGVRMDVGGRPHYWRSEDLLLSLTPGKKGGLPPRLGSQRIPGGTHSIFLNDRNLALLEAIFVKEGVSKTAFWEVHRDWLFRSYSSGRDPFRLGTEEKLRRLGIWKRFVQQVPDELRTAATTGLFWNWIYPALAKGLREPGFERMLREAPELAQFHLDSGPTWLDEGTRIEAASAIQAGDYPGWLTALGVPGGFTSLKLLHQFPLEERKWITPDELALVLFDPLAMKILSHYRGPLDHSLICLLKVSPVSIHFLEDYGNILEREQELDARGWEVCNQERKNLMRSLALVPQQLRDGHQRIFQLKSLNGARRLLEGYRGSFLKEGKFHCPHMTLRQVRRGGVPAPFQVEPPWVSVRDLRQFHKLAIKYENCLVTQYSKAFLEGRIAVYEWQGPVPHLLVLQFRPQDEPRYRGKIIPVDWAVFEFQSLEIGNADVTARRALADFCQIHYVAEPDFLRNRGEEREYEPF